MLVRNVCRRGVDTARADESVRVAAERMHQRSVGTLVVVEDERPIGIITDRDLALRVVAPGKDVDQTWIGDVMSPVPRTIAEDRSTREALSAMSEEPARRLPVVDKGGRLVGMVSVDDILLALTDELGRVGGVLERELPQAVAGR